MPPSVPPCFAPNLMADLAATLAPGDFGRLAHAVLWEAMCAMHAVGIPANPITVTAHLAETADLGRAGGAPYLHTLTAEVPSAPADATPVPAQTTIGRPRRGARPQSKGHP